MASMVFPLCRGPLLRLLLMEPQQEIDGHEGKAAAKEARAVNAEHHDQQIRDLSRLSEMTMTLRAQTPNSLKRSKLQTVRQRHLPLRRLALHWMRSHLRHLRPRASTTRRVVSLTILAVKSSSATTTVPSRLRGTTDRQSSSGIWIHLVTRELLTDTEGVEVAVVDVAEAEVVDVAVVEAASVHEEAGAEEVDMKLKMAHTTRPLAFEKNLGKPPHCDYRANVA